MVSLCIQAMTSVVRLLLYVLSIITSCCVVDFEVNIKLSGKSFEISTTVMYQLV